MTSRPHRRRTFAVLLLVPLFFALTGCLKVHTNIEVHADSDVHLATELVDTHDLLNLAQTSCASALGEIPADLIESFTDSAGNAGCRVSGPIDLAAPNDSFQIISDGDDYVFTISHLLEDLPGIGEGISLEDPALSLFSPDVLISVTFPGPVSYASEGALVEGNTVTWVGLNVLTEQVEARGSAQSQPSEGATQPGTNQSSGAQGEVTQGEVTQAPPTDEPAPPSSAELPTWSVIFIGLLLLAIIFLIMIVARNQRAKKSQHPRG